MQMMDIDIQTEIQSGWAIKEALTRPSAIGISDQLNGDQLIGNQSAIRHADRNPGHRNRNRDPDRHRHLYFFW